MFRHDEVLRRGRAAAGLEILRESLLLREQRKHQVVAFGAQAPNEALLRNQ